MMKRLLLGIGTGVMALVAGATMWQIVAPAVQSQALAAQTPQAYMPLVAQNPQPTATATPTAPIVPIASATATSKPMGTLVPTETPTDTPTGTLTPTKTPTQTPTGTLSPTATPTEIPAAIATATPTAGAPNDNSPPLEGFEQPAAQWQVRQQASGGSVTQSAAQAATGAFSARVASSSVGASAYLYGTYSDPASARTWGERPGIWRWQRARIYLPSTTVAHLGSKDSLTVAGLWPSAGGSYGWWLQVHKDGSLFVRGYDADGVERIFNVYSSFPLDQWVDVEIGLHSQNGPGVKRAFAFVINGSFHGWYHQGHLADETYDRAAFGILATTTAQPLELYVDDWFTMTAAILPGGPDTRPTATMQELDYRAQSGSLWQIDWSTWGQDLRMDTQSGLYSADGRLQSGMNLDRMPELSTGWAEIEIGWPQGTPPAQPNSYFGPMVGFRKEIAREENLEVIPIGDGAGNVHLVLEAWVGGAALIMAQWPMPLASVGSTHIPEAGDIIRARWDTAQPAGALRVRASYFDASSGAWFSNIIDYTFNANAVANNGVTVNFNDGYHTASSLTIDSPTYSIRRFKVGTAATALGD